MKKLSLGVQLQRKESFLSFGGPEGVFSFGPPKDFFYLLDTKGKKRAQGVEVAWSKKKFSLDMPSELLKVGSNRWVTLYKFVSFL
jgi:hypothetical protein